MQEAGYSKSSLSSHLDLAKAAGFPTNRFPETDQEADMVEDVLTKAMEKLSMEEHEKLIFDIHGVAQPEEEDPVTIDQKLKELEIALDNIPDKAAYLQAKQMNESYVTNRNFLLIFLRHEKFDAGATAKLLVAHFQLKLELFGSGDVLGRDVYQSDLSRIDRIVLETGFLRVLPTRDAAGRVVIVLTSGQVTEFPKEGYDRQNEFRTIWYLSMKALQDEETQKLGVVWVIVNYNGFKVSADHFQDTADFITRLPLRVSGAHLCYKDSTLRPYAAGFQLFAGENERNHLRLHNGTPEENDFKLQTFGIPTQDFELTADGGCSMIQHREWLKMLRSQEEAVATSISEHTEDSVIVPRRFDVLFGRTRQAREHTGTLRALHIVEMHFETYEALGKYQKTDVAEKILSIIHESGGRFLRQENNGAWVFADDTEARKKIAHWFRHLRQQKAQQSAQSTAQNSTEGISEQTNNIAKNSGVKSAAKRVTPCDSPSGDDAYTRDEVLYSTKNSQN